MKAYHIGGDVDSDDMLPLLAEAAGELGLILHGRDKEAAASFTVYRGTCGQGPCAALFFPVGTAKSAFLSLRDFFQNYQNKEIEHYYFFVGRDEGGINFFVDALREEKGEGRIFHLISYVFMMRGRENAVAFETHRVSDCPSKPEKTIDSIGLEPALISAWQSGSAFPQHKFRLNKEEISDFIEVGLALRGLSLR